MKRIQNVAHSYLYGVTPYITSLDWTPWVLIHGHQMNHKTCWTTAMLLLFIPAKELAIRDGVKYIKEQLCKFVIFCARDNEETQTCKQTTW